MTQDDANDRRLDERLRRLQPERPPARDLWPSIEARLESPVRARPARPRRRPAWPLLAMAASVAVVAVLAVRLLGQGDQLDQDAPGPPELAQEVAPVAPFGPGYELGSDYQAARAGLVDDLDRRLAKLDPEARAAVLENLETIRRAVTEINAALGDDPASVLLQNQLLATYQDELSVLANLQRVTGRLPTRNDI
jgi:hypothetical protein